MTYCLSCLSCLSCNSNIIKAIYTCYKFMASLCFDYYCKTKYFVFFIIFLNSVVLNYFYYKCFNRTSNKLILFLSYSINLNGCIIIKLIQWTNNQLLFLKNSSNNNKFISEIFSKYYENCYIHNISYTKSLFYEEFGIKFDDFVELDINYTIKSGSIAQVYKGIIKPPYNTFENSCIGGENSCIGGKNSCIGGENSCIGGKNSCIGSENSCVSVAIKVVHPEIEYQLIYPIYFFKIYIFFVTNCKCFKKYDTIYNFDAFFINLKKQINMINEYANNEYFYNKYYNHKIIMIPKPLMKSRHFLIMEYIEGEAFESLNISNYKKQVIICLLALFIKDIYMFSKYVHSDLHDANWKIFRQQTLNTSVSETTDTSSSYKIIIYDFGYVIENNLNDKHKKLIYYLDINNTYELGNLLFNEVQNLNIDYSNSEEVKLCKEKFIADFIKYNAQTYPYTDSNYVAAYNFCHNNGYKLNNSILELFISTVLLHKYFRKYIFTLFVQENSTFDQASYYKYIYNVNLYYVSICEKYNIFHDVNNYIKEQYITNPFFVNTINYNNNYFDSLNSVHSLNSFNSVHSLNSVSECYSSIDI